MGQQWCSPPVSRKLHVRIALLLPLVNPLVLITMDTYTVRLLSLGKRIRFQKTYYRSMAHCYNIECRNITMSTTTHSWRHSPLCMSGSIWTMSMWKLRCLRVYTTIYGTCWTLRLCKLRRLGHRLN
ncbi:hypothetical protein B0I35DRAFT_178192 [Stachybotrys elegans]|uniref:Uncharacterized protein n=1 Tax=Stachybotrys elegans TaxID=80388 RepID=A0A8K0WJ50_9HYPO|nr:hypothetical protein B0I35DRAFT_178192 [Stachybotrys elegans]